jgi:hypothetical protein
MHLTPASHIVEQSAFERVRRKLLSDPTDDRLANALASWVRPTDRSLPLAFLGRTLNDVLSTPFEQLERTRGVGSKKLACLIDLLERAAGYESNTVESADVRSPSSGQEPTTEAIWDQWRAAVMAHGLGSITLGRLVGSLHELPRSMWNTPLANYGGLTLRELNQLHRHGERRLSTVLKIFHDLYELLGEKPRDGHLCLAVESKTVCQLNTWTKHWLERVQSPDQEAVRLGFMGPIIEQLRIDANESLAEIAITITGVEKSQHGPQSNVKHRQTHSGDYHIDKIRAIVTARWAEGAERVGQLASQLEVRNERSNGLALFQASAGVFFAPACERFQATKSG